MSDLSSASDKLPRATSGLSGKASPLSEQVRSLRIPQAEYGRSRFPWFPWLLCLIFAGTTSWLGYRLYLKSTELKKLDSAGPVTSADVATDIIPVSEAKVAAMGEVALASKGYIIPAHQILVSPQVSGRLVKLNVEEGRRVAKGDVLAEIESTEYRADVSRSQAALELARQGLLELQNGNRPEEIEQSQAELSEAEASLKQLQAEWKRNQQLLRSNVVTEQDFEVTESRYRAVQRRVERLRFGLKLMKDGPRVERVESARAEMNQKESELVKAQWKLDNCLIRAPISGTILKKNAEEGNIVNPVAFNGSFSICEVADLSDLEVSLDIQERDVARVHPGQRCTVRTDAFPERVYQGVVSRLMPIADRAKGAIPVRVKLIVPAEEEGVYLKPEMGANVLFLNDEIAGTEGTPEVPTDVQPASPASPPSNAALPST